jgi:hypothetical protein
MRDVMTVVAIATVAEAVGDTLQTCPATARDVRLKAFITGKLTFHATCTHDSNSNAIMDYGYGLHDICNKLRTQKF